METNTGRAVDDRRMPSPGDRVRDIDGVEAVVESVHGRVDGLAAVAPAEGPAVTSGSLGAAAASPEPMVAMRGVDGRAFRLPLSLLARGTHDDWQAQVALAEVALAHGAPVVGADGPEELALGERLVVPVIEESLELSKRVVDRGGWRITRRVESRQETVDEPLIREDVRIERRPVDRLLPADQPPPAIRHEGDVMVVPVLEEVLVVEKRLVLREELLVHRERTEFRAPQQVLLRREQVSVDRIDAVEGRSDASSGLAADGRAS